MCNAGHYMETSNSNRECTQCGPGKYKETVAIALDSNEVCILEYKAQCDLYMQTFCKYVGIHTITYADVTQTSLIHNKCY